MVDRVVFEAQETGATPPEPPKTEAPALPDNLPENVKKSYNDMRAEVTRLQQELAKTKPATEPATTQVSEQKPVDPAKPEAPTEPAKKPDNPDDAAKKVTDAAGFDVSPFQQEYDTNGDVSPESRDKIAEGLKNVLGANARAIVDQFIEGQKVVHQNDRKMYMDAAGGDEAYTTMTTWAAQNLPADQVEVFNRQVTSGDRSATLFAIEGLRAKFEAAVGREPSLLRASSTPAAGGLQPFRSTAEMVRAMQDPRYKTDDAYREDVKKRLAAK